MSDSDEEYEESSNDGLSRQLSTYERQLRRTLRELDAKVDAYHFTIQKEDNGILIDLGFRAIIKPRPKSDED